MSDLHKKHGHFSEATMRQIRAIYKACPICGGNIATDYAGHTDHIVPLQLFDAAPEIALSLLKNLASAIHDLGNGWQLCGRCHARKTRIENEIAFEYQRLVAHANKYLRKCYTFKKSGEIVRKQCLKRQVKKVPRLAKRLRIRRERAERIAAARKG